MLIDKNADCVTVFRFVVAARRRCVLALFRINHAMENDMELATMNKTELRAACKDAKIKNYSKLNVASMREALTQLDTQERPEREERNGVRRPLRGVGADVWQALDELREKGVEDLTTAIRAIGEERNWNRNNVSIELSGYRRFHGIVRKKKA